MKLASLSKEAHGYFRNKETKKLDNCIQQINSIVPQIFEENMNLKESTLAAMKQINDWADANEVYKFMVDNGYFIGNSKTPDKSVASVLYRYAEEKILDKKKEKDQKIPSYKIKE